MVVTCCSCVVLCIMQLLYDHILRKSGWMTLSCSYLCTNITISNEDHKCTHILLTPLYYNIVLWQMSQGHPQGKEMIYFNSKVKKKKKALLDVKFNLVSSVICYVAVIRLTQLPRNVTHCSLRWIYTFLWPELWRTQIMSKCIQETVWSHHTQYKQNRSLCAM
jgi:hypothetical protein